MNKIILLGIFVFLFIPTNAFSQFVPKPVIEEEIRKKSSIKLRSNELERIKREANKEDSKGPNRRVILKFSEIRKDFEKIQKLQGSIIKAYTTGKKINYQKISNKSASMNKNALRLKSNLFNIEKESNLGVIETDSKTAKNVRNLIIELDKAIGKFTGNPMFKNLKVVNPVLSKKAQVELNKVIKLSDNLSSLSAQMKN